MNISVSVSSHLYTHKTVLILLKTLDYEYTDRKDRKLNDSIRHTRISLTGVFVSIIVVHCKHAIIMVL